MYDPPQTPETNSEWVEVYNRSGRTLDLNDVQFGDAAALVEVTGAATPLAPGGYAVLVRDAATFNATFPGVALVVQVTGFPTLNNTGDRPRLVAATVEVDAVPYQTSWGGSGESLERRDPAGPSTSAANFGSSTDPSGGTPGRQNSIFAADVTGPTLVSAVASADGRTVTLTLDEPADPASVSASAFTVSGASVTAAVYDAAALTVTLTLAAPLPGDATVTATGLRDLTGNTTATTSTTVAFTADTTPPGLAGASALSETTVEVAFTEPVTVASAQNPAAYAVDGGVGAPVSVEVEPGGGGAVGATLTFAAPFAGPRTFTLTASGLVDLVGNTATGATATFFFGAFATPAPREVVVNEIMYDPPAPQPSGNEWVELVNRTADRTFDLAALRFADAAGNPVAITATPTALSPGAFVVIGRDAAAFAAAYPGVPFVQVSGFPTLNNDADTPTVLLADGTVLDAVPYRASWGGVDASLERKDPNGPSTSARNFATSTDPSRATPGRQNSVFAPDTAGPTLASAVASPDGRTVTVTLDEPVDPATVTTGAFAVSGASVTSVAYDDDALTVTLGLAAPLTGDATVTATGLRDLLGNTTATTAIAVTFVPDVTPPGLARAFAETATTVRIEFTEPVTVASAQNAAAYSVDGGIGAPASVAVETEDGAAVAVVLTLATPLADREVYTLTVTGLVDLAGNAQPGTTAPLFFGTADTPDVGQLALTEIMFDPQTGNSEYLEVLNTTTDQLFDLRTVTLDDGDAADADALSDDPALVLPGAFVVVVRDGAAFAAQFPGVPFVEYASLSLTNAGEAVVLRSAGAVADSVFYDPEWHRAELDDATGIALERRDPAGPSNARSNWSSSLDESGGTPGRANSLSIADPAVPRGDAITVTSPFAPDDGEAARITYTLDATAANVRVRIFDGGGRLVREVEDGRLSGQTGEVEWDGTGDDRRRLRAGIYVVLLEAVDAEGGTTEAHRAAVVLARR